MVKHQEVSKYYQKDCLQNYLLFFMSLLKAPFVENIILKLEFTLSF